MQNNKSGFSLIELSVVLVIIGILLVAILQAYRIYDEKQKIERMRLAMATVEQSIKNFPNMVDPATIDPATGIGQPYGRLPCPAPLNGTGTGNNFDTENCVSPSRPSGAPQVMVGKIPTATLGLHNDSMRDIYGNYLLYAVSDAATSSATYGLSPGNITVIEEGTDRNPSSPAHGSIIELETHTNVQFTVVSMGRESQGAYAFDGSQPNPCPSNVIKEHENCNGDAVFLSSYLHNAGVNNTYDDNIIFASNLTATRVEEPQFCEQIEMFGTDAAACPDGWSEEILPTAAGNSTYVRAYQYNVDPETGDYFFTLAPTPYTVTQTTSEAGRPGNAAGRIPIACRRNPGNAARTRCFSERMVASGTAGSGPRCPDGWVYLGEDEYSNARTPRITCGRM